MRLFKKKKHCWIQYKVRNGITQAYLPSKVWTFIVIFKEVLDEGDHVITLSKDGSTGNKRMYNTLEKAQPMKRRVKEGTFQFRGVILYQMEVISEGVGMQ